MRGGLRICETATLLVLREIVQDPKRGEKFDENSSKSMVVKRLERVSVDTRLAYFSSRPKAISHVIPNAIDIHMIQTSPRGECPRAERRWKMLGKTSSLEIEYAARYLVQAHRIRFLVVRLESSQEPRSIPRILN